MWGENADLAVASDVGREYRISDGHEYGHGSFNGVVVTVQQTIRGGSADSTVASDKGYNADVISCGQRCGDIMQI